MGLYFDRLKFWMERIDKLERPKLFLGQAVTYAGTAMTNTVAGCSKDNMLELPVFEDTQMGMTLGLSMAGILPVSIYPRLNFLICAANQLVNHVDKYELMTGLKPHIIIRSCIGSEKPMHPSHQHIGDLSEGISLLCKNIKVKRLDHHKAIDYAYDEAINKPGVYVMVEWGDKYAS